MVVLPSRTWTWQRVESASATPYTDHCKAGKAVSTRRQRWTGHAAYNVLAKVSSCTERNDGPGLGAYACCTRNTNSGTSFIARRGRERRFLSKGSSNTSFFCQRLSLRSIPVMTGRPQGSMLTWDQTSLHLGSAHLAHKTNPSIIKEVAKRSANYIRCNAPFVTETRPKSPPRSSTLCKSKPAVVSNVWTIETLDFHQM